MTEDQGTIATKSKGARTSDRLLDAAEALFAQKGYEATALRDVAEAVNISQPGLYKHFASKEDLYCQVLQRALQPLADEMEATIDRPTTDASFHQLTSRLIEIMVQHPRVPILLIRSMLSPPSARDEIGLEWVNRMTDYGRRITLASNLDIPTTDMALHIVAVFNMLFGYFWAAPVVGQLSGLDPLDPEMVARQKAFLARFISSLSKVEPAPQA